MEPTEKTYRALLQTNEHRREIRAATKRDGLCFCPECQDAYRVLRKAGATKAYGLPIPDWAGEPVFDSAVAAERARCLDIIGDMPPSQMKGEDLEWWWSKMLDEIKEGGALPGWVAGG